MHRAGWELCDDVAQLGTVVRTGIRWSKPFLPFLAKKPALPFYFGLKSDTPDKSFLQGFHQLHTYRYLQICTATKWIQKFSVTRPKISHLRTVFDEVAFVEAEVAEVRGRRSLARLPLQGDVEFVEVVRQVVDRTVRGGRLLLLLWLLLLLLLGHRLSNGRGLRH